MGTVGFEPPTNRFRLVTNPNESKFKEFYFDIKEKR